MTIKKLAELSGFSIGTVSKAFSGSREISEDTRQKIFEIAKLNNCYENLNTRKFPKKIIGIIVSDISGYSSVLNQLESCIRASGAVPVIMTGSKSKKAEAELVDISIRYKKTDGVIIVNPNGSYSHDCVIPLSIEQENAPSLADAIALLKRGGHSRISFIATSKGSYSSGMFKKLLAENGIRSGGNYYAESDSDSELSGYETMGHLFEMSTIPTAIISESDAMAKGAEKYIVSRGLKVPKDISVIGLESFNQSEDTGKQCRKAVSQLIANIEAYNKRDSKK